MVTKPSAAAKKAPAKAPAKPAAKVAPKPSEKPHKEHKEHREHKERKDPKDPFEKYRKRLLVRQEELILDISRNRAVTDETVDEQAQDMVDRATSAYTREFAFSLSEADRKALLLIEQALLQDRAGDLRRLRPLPGRRPGEAARGRSVGEALPRVPGDAGQGPALIPE